MSVIGRNALSLLTSQAAIWAIAAVMLVVAPRFLGEVDFGRLSFATSYVGFFMLVGLLGTNTYLVRLTARDPSLVGPYVFNALVLKLVLGVVLAAAAVGLGVLLGYERQTLLLIAAAAVTMSVGLLNDSLLAGLHGLERMARPATWNVAQQYVAAALCLSVVAAGRGVVAYAAALVPAAVIPVVANARDLRGELRGHAHIDLRVWRSIAVGGVPFLVSSAIMYVYGSIDLVMLRPLAGDATVGWYALAYRWLSLPVVVAATGLAALFPSLSVQGVALTDRFFATARLSLKFVAFVGLPLSAGIALVADDLIRIVYADDFRQSVPLVVIMAVGIPIIMIDMVLANVLITTDRQNAWLVVGLVAAIMNPLLNLFAIPFTVERYQNGAIGAATMTVLTELLMLAGFVRLQPKGLLDREVISFVARCALATAAVVAAVLTIRSVPLFARVVVGAVVYGLASILLGTASLQKLRRWRTRFGR